MAKFKIEIMDVDPCTKRMEAELPYSEYQSELEKAYRVLNRKVVVPGFRQGKTPLRVLERHYKDRVEQEVIQQLVLDARKGAVEEKNLRPLGVTRLEDVKVEKDKPVSFVFTMEVKPELGEVNYEGFEFKKALRKITPKDIDNEIEALREDLAELVEKADGKIEKGDYAIIDYQLFPEGQLVSIERKENYMLLVGDDELEGTLGRQLIGMKKGEEKKVSMRIPQEHRRKELAGKDVFFLVKVREIKTKVLPPLNEEFARRLGDYETMDELRERVGKMLGERAERQAESKLNDDIISKLVEENPIESPPSLVEEELNLRFLFLKRELQKQGLRTKLSKEGLEEWRRNHYEQALNKVKGDIILERIAQLKGVEVSEEELEEQVKRIGGESGQNPLRLKAKMQENGSLDRLRESLVREKALNNIRDNYKIELLTEEGEP